MGDQSGARVVNGGELRAVFSRDGVCFYRGNRRITEVEWFEAMGRLVALDARERSGP
jgi:hypothetical protein